MLSVLYGIPMREAESSHEQRHNLEGAKDNNQ